MTAFPNNPDLHREIAAALNRHGVDNDTATPDYILAEYAIVSIQNFANARADIAERQESQPERGERVPEALRKYAYALHEQAKVAAKKGDYVKAGQKELCAQAFDGAIQRAEREERVPDRIKMLVDAFREQAFDDPPTLYVEGFSDAIRIAARELERTIREIEGGEDA